MIDLARRSKISNDSVIKVFKRVLKNVDLLTMNLSLCKTTAIYPLKVLTICLPKVVKYLQD